LRIINKDKRKIPTYDQFMDYIPTRLDYEWSINSDGFVELKIPKFKGNVGKSLCKFIKKENFFIAKMDKIGSMVWKNCDGTRSVDNILEILKKQFPDEKNIDQRLIYFIQQMKNLNYMVY
jgi:hypothetical protein